MSAAKRFGLLFLITLAAPVPESGAQPTRPEFVPGEVLVQLTTPASPALSGVLSRTGVELARQVSPSANVFLLRTGSMDVADAVAQLRRDASVRHAVPNYYRYLDLTSSDPELDRQWALDNSGQTGGTPDADIDAFEAWDLFTGSPDVVVAVLDSGTDISHPDLRPNLWVNPGEDLNGDGNVTNDEVNGIDDDGNGFIDDLIGWDFADDDLNPSPVGTACSGHGTHTGGTIAAVGDNAEGIAGVSWNASIMTLRVFEPLLGILCSADDADLIEAINYAGAMGVPISSNSWGGGPFNPLMEDAIRASGMLFVAAAGNGGDDGFGDDNDTTSFYPASYGLSNVVAVAATDHDDSLAAFSNFGAASVDLGAPGVSIASTLPGGYGFLSGTSMATPHVAGVAALLLSQDPTYTTNELSFRLRYGVDPLVALTQTTSGGRLNALGSLQVENAATDGVSVEVSPAGGTVIPRGGTLDWSLTVRNNLASPIHTAISFLVKEPAGHDTFLIGPLVVQVPAGAEVTRTRSFAVAADAPLGIHELFGQTATATTFEEDVFPFEVVP